MMVLIRFNNKFGQEGQRKWRLVFSIGIDVQVDEIFINCLCKTHSAKVYTDKGIEEKHHIAAFPDAITFCTPAFQDVYTLKNGDDIAKLLVNFNFDSSLPINVSMT